MLTFECPICSKTVSVERREDAPFRPFCCERCKLVDLGRWLDGSYRVSEPVPSEPPNDESDAPPSLHDRRER